MGKRWLHFAEYPETAAEAPFGVDKDFMKMMDNEDRFKVCLINSSLNVHLVMYLYGHLIFHWLLNVM